MNSLPLRTLMNKLQRKGKYEGYTDSNLINILLKEHGKQLYFDITDVILSKKDIMHASKTIDYDCRQSNLSTYDFTYINFNQNDAFTYLLTEDPLCPIPPSWFKDSEFSTRLIIEQLACNFSLTDVSFTFDDFIYRPLVKQCKISDTKYQIHQKPTAIIIEKYSNQYCANIDAANIEDKTYEDLYGAKVVSPEYFLGEQASQLKRSQYEYINTYDTKLKILCFPILEYITLDLEDIFLAHADFNRILNTYYCHKKPTSGQDLSYTHAELNTYESHHCNQNHEFISCLNNENKFNNAFLIKGIENKDIDEPYLESLYMMCEQYCKSNNCKGNCKGNCSCYKSYKAACCSYACNELFNSKQNDFQENRQELSKQKNNIFSKTHIYAYLHYLLNTMHNDPINWPLKRKVKNPQSTLEDYFKETA